MSDNPYGSPQSPTPASPAPAALAGRILAPLLAPLLLVPVALGVGFTLYEGIPLSSLGMSILNFVPLAVLLAVVVSPLSMLALLPFRYLSWLWRGVLAAAVQLALVLILMVAAPLYSGHGPVEVELPRRVG